MEQKKVMMKTLRELMSSSHIEVMRKIQNFFMNLYGCQIDLIHKYHHGQQLR